MAKKFLNTIKKQLLEEKERLDQEINKLAQRGKRRLRIRFTDFGSKDDENALEVRTLSDKVSLEGNIEKGLKAVERALERLKQGKYGICEQCGKKINEKRLKIFPAATVCVECKKNSFDK
ncbi:TraR/DksA C4-type zinc finger protein [Patescibacteria group bacterium]|nr:TraR/DksA C4-type zinc finger protein [Patescibacteria group bacterium]MBU4512327.1 TraR/DksA C4-type zinc finger protein [Patescibacteria group bacterium]MCG2692551.1 TraR/DksA C4-type zinc finger protein [Candidatus Parcubacteria bacterium]